MSQFVRTVTTPVFWTLDKMALSCDVHTRIVSAAMDRELTVSEKIKYFIHGLVCHFCRRYERQLSAMRRAARANAMEFGQRTARSLREGKKAELRELLRKGG